MNLTLLVEGPLLWAAMILFFGAVSARMFFFLINVGKASALREPRGRFIAGMLGRFLLPLHMLLGRRTGYSSLRILFHATMVIVPVWLSSHIVLWEVSRLGWSWPALAPWLADTLTLLFLATALFFLIRRIKEPNIRAASSLSDYCLLAVTTLPFLTGFLSTHGILQAVPVLGSNMQVIHEFTGEVMLVAAAVLFCRPRISEETCIGCAACELSCPTGTLQTTDEAAHRIFTYSHYQCVCCGNCVKTCPELAAELRHELSAPRFLQVASKYEIRKVELKECQQCGARFAPEPQLDKIRNMPKFEKVQKILEERQMRLCPQCRTNNHADILHRVAPVAKTIKKAAAGK